jgi:putative DNA primase/helicase
LIEWEETERSILRSSIAKVASERAVILARIKKLTDKAASADDADDMRAYLQEIDGLKRDLPEELHAPRLFGNDTTPESAQTMLSLQGERYAILGDEPGIFSIMGGAYSGGRPNNDVFLQSHAGSSFRAVRAEREAYLTAPAMSIGIMIQPGILEEVANNSQFRHSGIVARFLTTIPENNIGKRDVRRSTAIPKSVTEEYRAGVLRLLEGRKNYAVAPQRIDFAAAATELWFDFAEEIELQQADGGRFEAIRDWTGKLPGAVARIAALLEIAEVGHSVSCVGAESVARAIGLGRLLIEHAVVMFGMIGASDEDVDAKAILRWIKAGEHRTFDRTTLYNAQEARFGGRVERLDEAVKRLQKWGAIRVHQVRPEKKAGRPATVIAVNPMVFLH